ncbi:ABC transporter ATP-binding protein [Mesoplasma tabanidae]|uniref:ABC transporter ATP-binding protein n=1 Tax=Mesoplasma tabanidae TaxID=219745 RepID=A0A2K8P462_9MOLU|nr:ABC transporter ATP-binding protein [Mesoplasma tabanidae]ATZ21544.1 ABC transporter ATP-binding protein [Mesoplasma tabanidae]
MINKKNKETFFSVQNMSKSFKNNAGVENINFNISQGDIVGLIGDNGVGKTTIIKLIFNQYKNDTGFISFKGSKDLNYLKEIAFFPDQNNYPKHFNIVEFANYCANLKGISRKEIKVKIDNLLKALNLFNHKNNKFDELSAGMQKRALLLSILVTNPKIIILDEPTANLDVQSRIEFIEVLLFLVKEFKTTIIITSHIIDELNDFITRAIFIKKIKNKGHIVYDKDFDKNKQNLKEIYVSLTKQKSLNYTKIKKILLKEIKNENKS